jgi:multicomponent Na+:H+ antiporter subunit C
MVYVIAITIGALVTAGVYLLLRRSIVRLLFGLVLLGHAANLAVFSAPGLVRGRAPLVPEGAMAPPAGYADPVPQALVLTAIVIGFAIVAFAAVLLHRSQEALETADVDEIRETDR